MNFSIGIASGHQECHALAIENNKVVATCAGDSLNHHNFDIDNVIARFQRIMVALARELSLNSTKDLREQTDRIVLSLPGVSTIVDRELGLFFLRAIGWKNEGVLRVVDDTWSGLVAGLLKDKGICAFAGSGASVFFGHDGFVLGKPYKLDGYGVVIGDFGSGFRTATKLIETVGRTFDMGREHDLFQEILALEPELSQAGNIQTWFDSLQRNPLTGDWRTRVARLAAVATVAAESDPPHGDAKWIVCEAASEIAKTIEIGLARFGQRCANLPITCQGGMFLHSDLYFSEVCRIVGEKFGNTVTRAAYHPVVGAALIARAAADEPMYPVMALPFQRPLPNPAVARAILESVFELPREKWSRIVFNASPDQPFGEND